MWIRNNKRKDIYNRSKKSIRKRRKSDRRGYRSFIREPASDGTSCWKSGTSSKSRFIQISYKTDKIKNKHTRITRETQGKIITVGNTSRIFIKYKVVMRKVIVDKHGGSFSCLNVEHLSRKFQIVHCEIQNELHQIFGTLHTSMVYPFITLHRAFRHKRWEM